MINPRTEATSPFTETRVEPLSLSTNDLLTHVVTFGMDIYPPIEIPKERTHLHMFYEEARVRWDRLFDELKASDQEFRISKSFRRTSGIAGPSSAIETFVLTARGPVFVFPLLLPEPLADTGLERTYVDDFNQVRRLFSQALSVRTVMRVGLIRDLIFATGKTPCGEMLTDQTAFANAALVGGQSVLKYQDSQYNHHIRIEPVSLTRTTQLLVGTTINEPAGYGVKVQVDVNNANIQQPLQEPDIQAVIDRATSLWPDQLLEYLNELPRRNRS